MNHNTIKILLNFALSLFIHSLYMGKAAAQVQFAEHHPHFFQLTDHPELDFAGNNIDMDMTFWLNKTYSLTPSFYPRDLMLLPASYSYFRNLYLRPQAHDALIRLIDQANAENLPLIALSAFRSYQTQQWVFAGEVATYGWDIAVLQSAQAGHSEHQLGVTVDLTTPELGYSPWNDFWRTPQATWLQNNAHTFGFTISYQEGTQPITGYIYEPWHIRYVGKNVATYLYENNLVLESYFQYLSQVDPIIIDDNKDEEELENTDTEEDNNEEDNSDDQNSNIDVSTSCDSEESGTFTCQGKGGANCLLRLLDGYFSPWSAPQIGKILFGQSLNYCGKRLFEGESLHMEWVYLPSVDAWVSTGVGVAVKN